MVTLAVYFRPFCRDLRAINAAHSERGYQKSLIILRSPCNLHTGGSNLVTNTIRRDQDGA